MIHTIPLIYLQHLRSIRINLNSRLEMHVQRLCIVASFFCPTLFAILLLHLTDARVFSTGQLNPSIWGLLLIALACPVCGLKFLNNELIFGKSSLVVPSTSSRGICRKSIQYKSIEKIVIENTLLKIATKSLGYSKQFQIPLDEISCEDATILWEQLSKSLSNSALDAKLRQQLLHWKNSESRTAPVENCSTHRQLGTPQKEFDSSPLCRSLAWISLATVSLTLISVNFAAAVGLANFNFSDLLYHSYERVILGTVWTFLLTYLENLPFLNLLIFLIASALFLQLLKNRQISIDSTGINSSSSSYVFWGKGKKIPWTHITRIELKNEVRKTLRNGRSPSFLIFSKNLQKPISMPLSCLQDEHQRKLFENNLLEHCSNSVCDDDTRILLAALSDNSFTRLWLCDLQQSQVTTEANIDVGHINNLLTVWELKYVRKLSENPRGAIYLVAGKFSQSVLKEIVLTPNQVAALTASNALQALSNASKTLRNSGIVRLTESFIDSDKLYFLFPYIEGRTLQESIEQGGPLPEELAAKYALQLCNSLQALHGLDPAIIHSDVSPYNVILGKDEQIILVDFGVPSITAEGALILQSNANLHFSAPELFRGTPCCQSDIYSLGATIYFALTGKLPVPIQCNELPETLFSPALIRIVKLATAQSVDDRYPSIAALRKDLETLIGENIEPVSDAPNIIDHELEDATITIAEHRQ